MLGKVRKGEIAKRDIWRRLNTHTKIILVMTGSLLLFGMLITLLFEYNNPLTIGNMSTGDKLLNAFFQSVTLRTAGFVSFSQKGLTDSSVLVSCLIMLIGLLCCQLSRAEVKRLHLRRRSLHHLYEERWR